MIHFSSLALITVTSVNEFLRLISMIDEPDDNVFKWSIKKSFKHILVNGGFMLLSEAVNDKFKIWFQIIIYGYLLTYFTIIIIAVIFVYVSLLKTEKKILNIRIIELPEKLILTNDEQEKIDNYVNSIFLINK